MESSVQLIAHMGSDNKVVEDARMSIAGDKVRANKGPNIKLINYLMGNGHSTPFEGCTATFEVVCPIFIARQWMRHRTFSYNEMSARYGEVPEEWLQVSGTWRSQAEKNKQCSGGLLSHLAQKEVDIVYQTSCVIAYTSYLDLLRHGVSREQARMLLPQSMFTKFRVTGNLWNYMRFIGLRDHEHAQEEIRVLAREVKTLLEGLFPQSMEAWENKND